MKALDILLFQIFPYVAAAVFLLGSWARFDHAAYTWRTGSSQLLSGRGMRLAVARSPLSERSRSPRMPARLDGAGNYPRPPAP